MIHQVKIQTISLLLTILFIHCYFLKSIFLQNSIFIRIFKGEILIDIVLSIIFTFVI